jgi:phosphate transport system permease protein
MVNSRSKISRSIVDWGFRLITALVTGVSLICLGWVLFDVIKRGSTVLHWEFFTHLPTPPGIAGGGLANAIVGTGVMVVLATLVGGPIGMLAGIYLAEFGRESRFGILVRFALNTLLGIPSILIGLCVFLIVVAPTHQFSGYAGALALSLLIVPAVARVTEDMLCMVPDTLREAVFSLGIPHWLTILTIFFRTARSGLLTGVLLAIARVSGETAPLLITALNSPYILTSLNEPTANLTVTIFQYANSPYPNWKQMAWGAALVIVLSVFLLNLLARFVVKETAS